MKGTLTGAWKDGRRRTKSLRRAGVNRRGFLQALGIGGAAAVVAPAALASRPARSIDFPIYDLPASIPITPDDIVHISSGGNMVVSECVWPEIPVVVGEWPERFEPGVTYARLHR
jgi:hypothetical protein